ncbi:GH115-C domain-containing protein [Mycena chlorophos]|uniref:GH115-C domain-containing protein n=1 Tax=Mycena chlorophos TaxID=658473 RepID=A0A8H6SV18_MYCCL|nr:GH115-C domain-containing protein [Mycena chlorophos]
MTIHPPGPGRAKSLDSGARFKQWSSGFPASHRMRLLPSYVAVAAVSLGLLPSAVNAIGQATCVSFKSSSNVFTVADDGKAAPILTSSDDWPGVHRAVQDFAADIQRVTGLKAKVANVTASSAPHSSLPIIIGTLGRSSLIDQIVNNTKLNVSDVEGQWEAFKTQVVENPLPGISKAYVMVGADKRGTIFSLYDHSEQFGVSPWYWWADVPVAKHSSLFVAPTGCAHGSPTIQYRAIFLNDEQPALQGWAAGKFVVNEEGSALTDSPFNRYFYSNLFELILRLRANHLWPAQWSSAFGVDDDFNQFNADYYGVIMGTRQAASCLVNHEEPMMRSIPVEWTLFGVGPWDYGANPANINAFWLNGTIRSKDYENMWTVGMRGDGDEPIEGDAIQLLEWITANQTAIFQEVFGANANVSEIPQVWCLYKEVEGYYDNGLRVADYIALLWTDDNWGNIRRYPLPSERNRTGGAGVYYHVDYVGDPRDYKWIASSQISKIFEQMSIAVDRQATRIWVLNVGDLKPNERETEFFLTYAYDSSLWTPDNLGSFVSAWAQREFAGLASKDVDTVVDIVANLTRWNMRRKPELVNGTTYSLVSYREAENVQAAWNNLQNKSTEIYNSLPADTQPAFFELVHHPVLASANLGNMYIKAGQNVLRASQARQSANTLADEVEELFEHDFDLETEYHTLLDGKWDGMMLQTHIGYAYWQQPMTNSMPLISRVQTKKQSLPGVMRLSPEGTMGTWPGDNMFQCPQMYSCGPPTLVLDPYDTFGNRFVDVGAGGPVNFTFTAETNASWLTVNPTKGSVAAADPEVRVWFSVDWDEVPEGLSYANVTFHPFGPGVDQHPTPAGVVSYPVNFIANKTVLPENFTGFVESAGAISFEAEHASRNNTVNDMFWRILPGLGRTLSGVTPWPRLGNNENNFTAGTGPSLEYDFYTFNDDINATVTTYVSPSGNGFGADRPLGFALQVDDGELFSNYFFPAAVPGSEPPQWDGNDGFAANSIITVPNEVNMTAGAHTLKIFMIEPAVVVQKIVIDTGGVQPSYLGPPESIHVS